MSSVVHTLSRGIVIFNDTHAIMWQNEDGHAVIKWAESFDSSKHPYAAAHKGVYHAVVYQMINGEVIYETQH